MNERHESRCFAKGRCTITGLRRRVTLSNAISTGLQQVFTAEPALSLEYVTASRYCAAGEEISYFRRSLMEVGRVEDLRSRWEISIGSNVFIIPRERGKEWIIDNFLS